MQYNSILLFQQILNQLSNHLIKMDNLFGNSMSYPYYYGPIPLIYFPSYQSGPFNLFSTQKASKQLTTHFKIQEQSNEALPQSFSIKKGTKQTKIKKTRTHKKKRNKSTKVIDFLKKIKDKNYSSKHQKKGRNMPSIIFRLFITFVLKHTNLQNLYLPIAKRYGLSIDNFKFMHIFKEYFPQETKYLRRGLIQDVCFDRIQQPQFSLAFRILMRNFLKTLVFPTVYCSLKLSRKNKVKQAKFVKEVYQMIFGNNQMKKQIFSNISGTN